MLWVRALDSLQTRPLPGTEGAVAGPFWSPDSRQIGFGIGTVPRRLKRVDVVSGVTDTLAEFSGFYREGTWNADGDIVFGEAGTGLWRIRVPGGSPVQVTALDATRGEIQHAEPVFLPGGRQFLYHRTARTSEQSGIFIGSLDAKPGQQSAERLLASDSGPVFARGENGGFILFLREGILLSQGFDGARLEGDPIRVAENVGGVGSHGWFSASATGTLVYRSRQDAGQLSELAWFDRSGARVGQIGSAANFNNVQLSPNGRRVLTSRSDTTQLTAPRFSPDGRQIVQTTAGTRLWIADVSRGIFGQVFPENAPQGSPAISNDDRIAYTSAINGAIGDIYLVSATGIGTPEPLIVKSSTIKHPNHFSPDGRYLIFDDHTSQKQDLFVVPITPDSTGARKPIPFLVTPAEETFGQFSPDGRWVAYTSDESGRHEVFVRGFAPDRVPATGVGKWTISTAGGDKPRWSADGRELYYLSPDRKLMAVAIARGATFEPGVPKALFDVPLITGFFPYDVAPDGRFLFNVVPDTPKSSASPLTVVLNWQSALH
jgi:hypothetical protein